MEKVLVAIGPLDNPTLASFRYLSDFQCLGYKRGKNPVALEVCFDAHGRVVEAFDRRQGEAGDLEPPRGPDVVDAPPRPRRGRPAARAHGRARAADRRPAREGRELRERTRAQFEGAIQVSVALLVLWTAIAVGSVRPWNIPIGRTLRWVVLAELGAIAARLRVAEARTRRPARRVDGAGRGAPCARAALGALVARAGRHGGARADRRGAVRDRSRDRVRHRRARRARRARAPRGARRGGRRCAARAAAPVGRPGQRDRAGDDRDAGSLQRPRREPEHDVDAARARGSARGVGVSRRPGPAGRSPQGSRSSCSTARSSRRARAARSSAPSSARSRSGWRSAPGAQVLAVAALRGPRPRRERRAHAGSAARGPGSRSSTRSSARGSRSGRRTRSSSCRSSPRSTSRASRRTRSRGGCSRRAAA